MIVTGFLVVRLNVANSLAEYAVDHPLIAGQRPKPNSSNADFKDMLPANILIAPCPTVSANADATTIHHLFSETYCA